MIKAKQRAGRKKPAIITKARIERVLDEVRPALAADGGNVEFVSAENGIVKLRFLGACGGCPMSALTLKGYIETVLKQKIKGIKSVEAV